MSKKIWGGRFKKENPWDFEKIDFGNSLKQLISNYLIIDNFNFKYL